MDKELIERIALQAAEETGLKTNIFCCYKTNEAVVNFAKKLLERIDAERGKEAAAWVEVIDSREVAYSFHGMKLLHPGKHYLFLAPQPAIPEGWALVPELSTSAMDIAGMEAVDMEGFSKAEAEICYIAMLATKEPRHD